MHAMKPNKQIVWPKAAPASGLLLLVLLLATAFAASNYYSSPNTEQLIDTPASSSSANAMACDVAKGEWVPDLAAPYYTNATCPLIDSRQDCMKYGKPGMESILGWRWQPHGCDLPRFDAAAFLRLVRGKSMAFVGDSVARNHMQSLMCLLAKVEYPREVEPKDCVHCTRKYHYREHGFTVCVFWTPFLVRWNLARAGGQQFMDPHNVYLDEPDPEWARDVAGYDYVLLNGARWFTRPTVFYEDGRILGCANVQDGGGGECEAVSAVEPRYAVRASFRTALRALAGFRGRVDRGAAALRERHVVGRRELREDAARAEQRDEPAGSRGGVPRRAGGGVPGRGQRDGGEAGADGRERDDADEGRRAPRAVRALGAREGGHGHRLHTLVTARPRRRLERPAAPFAAEWLSSRNISTT